MTGSSGVSSALRLLDSITDASEYWIARRSLSSGGHSADPLAGDDGWACGGAFAFNELPPASVIARSEATKQSIFFCCDHGLLRGACHRARIRATRWLAMTLNTRSRPRGAKRPRPCMKSLAHRGRGERRMPVAPAASRALCIGRTHTSKRVHRNHPTFPHAMVLTVSFVLSPVTGLVATVACGLSLV